MGVGKWLDMIGGGSKPAEKKGEKKDPSWTRPSMGSGMAEGAAKTIEGAKAKRDKALKEATED